MLRVVASRVHALAGEGLSHLKAVNDRRLERSQKLTGIGKEARRYKVGDQVLVNRRNVIIPEGIRALFD